MSQYQFDPNHPGIQMVDNMRMQGKAEDEIRNKLSGEETKLQEQLFKATTGRNPQTPEQGKVSALHKLEVGLAYLQADDLSKPDAREKVAMVQNGVRPAAGSAKGMTQPTAAGRFQQQINAQSAPSAAKPQPGVHTVKFAM